MDSAHPCASGARPPGTSRERGGWTSAAATGRGSPSSTRSRRRVLLTDAGWSGGHPNAPPASRSERGDDPQPRATDRGRVGSHRLGLAVAGHVAPAVIEDGVTAYRECFPPQSGSPRVDRTLSADRHRSLGRRGRAGGSAACGVATWTGCGPAVLRCARRRTPSPTGRRAGGTWWRCSPPESWAPIPPSSRACRRYDVD